MIPYEFSVSNIIVSYNSLRHLEKCVDSLKSARGIKSEIIVFDNASDDGTSEFLKNQSFDSILSQRNLGYGRAANRAAARARGKYLFILNPDTLIPPDALERLLAYADDNPDVGLISPALCYPDGRPQLSARRMPMRRDFLLGRGSPLFKLGITGEKKAGYILSDSDSPVEVPAVSATAVLIKSALFRELGGFDERFFMYLEDLDLCRRITDRGLKIFLLPSVTVYHSWRQSSSRRPYLSAFHHHSSVWKYFRKHYDHQRILNLLLLVALWAGFVVSSLITVFKKGRKN